MPKMKMDDWVDRQVRVTREVETQGGMIFPAGTVFTVYGHWRGKLHVWLTNTCDKCGIGQRHGIRHLSQRDVELVPEAEELA